MQVERFVRRQMIKCSSACSCFNKKKNFQLKVVVSHLKRCSTENLELNRFGLEWNLKGKLIELGTSKQNADAVQLGRK